MTAVRYDRNLIRSTNRSFILDLIVAPFEPMTTGTARPLTWLLSCALSDLEETDIRRRTDNAAELKKTREKDHMASSGMGKRRRMEFLFDQVIRSIVERQ
jgi:hypothetical protein